jgi:tRNA threonylcarbamoyladenosine biosynthesis protein TsaE
MPERHLCSNSEVQTEALGERLAACLRVGDVLALYGDLGSGKTTLVRGIARGLGSADPVSSPTFVLLHLYEGRLPLYHFDAWRLAGPQDLAAIGAEDYLEGDGVAVVEWSERAQGLLPAERLEIHLERGADPDQRRLRLVGLGRRGAELLEDLE